MAILKIEHVDNYSVISNDIFRDKELSYKAKGILGYMLTCKDDWNFKISSIAAMGNDGRRSVAAGLIELEKKGYLRRSFQSREEGSGSIVVYHVFEAKQHVNFYEERINRGEREITFQHLLFQRSLFQHTYKYY